MRIGIIRPLATALLADFKPTGERYILAGRLSGRFKTALKQDGKHLARLATSLDQAAAEARIQAEQAGAKAAYQARQKPEAKDHTDAVKIPEPPPLAETDPAQDRRQRLEALNKEVEGLNRRFAGWSFVIPPDKYSGLDKSADDLLKPAEGTQGAGPKTGRSPKGKG